MTYDAPWERGAAKEEMTEESLILRMQWRQSPLEVYIPEQRTKVKVGEERFLEQLESRWRKRYGSTAHFSWLEAGGARWRVCRRPSVEGNATVYQMVSVRAGEAYMLVAMTPLADESLPEPLRELLVVSQWGLERKEPPTSPQDEVPVVASVVQPVAPIAAPDTIMAAAVEPVSEPAPAATPPVLGADIPAKATETRSGVIAVAVEIPQAAAIEPASPMQEEKITVPAPTEQPTSQPAQLEPVIAMAPSPVVAGAPVLPAETAPAITAPAYEQIPPANKFESSTAETARPVPAEVIAPTPSPTAVESVDTAPAQPIEVRRRAPRPGDWQLRRTVLSMPAKPDWDGLIEAEGKNISGDGLIGGIGLSRIADGLSWFIEGHAWVPGERRGELRLSAARQWRLNWLPLDTDWLVGEKLTLPFVFSSDSLDQMQAGAFFVEARVAAICAPQAEVIQTLDLLEQGNRAAVEKLEAMRVNCEPKDGSLEPVRIGVDVAELAKAADHRISRPLSILLPPSWADGVKTRGKDKVRRLILEVRFMASDTGDQLGDALLKPIRLYWVFVPRV